MRRTIPEQVVPGRRLGRHVHHDPESLRYLVTPRAHAARTVQWQRVTPILDQGDTRSCTGNAAVGVLGSTPYRATLPAAVRLDEDEALAIYSAATALDGFDGTYPPDDTGSDGLSAAKAAQRAGLISGYRHCTSVDAVITALQAGPVITGVNWYSGMDNPNPGGLATVTGQVRGAHEFEAIGVDLEARLLHCVNSWGTGWALAGHFYLTLTDYERLLREQGDATAFVPVNQPAPTPSPGGTVSFTAAETATITAWSSKRHTCQAAAVAAILKGKALFR